MKIINLYGPFIKAFEESKGHSLEKAVETDSRLKLLQGMAKEWGLDFKNIQRWMTTPQYASQKQLALRFTKNAEGLLQKVEGTFNQELIGELHLSPSFMRFDGFARYDSGSHTVWFGIDHPDASDAYLQALLAHELSHVYRDHKPAVWAHLGKPLEKVSRAEYLDNTTAQEHLASEGMATLFSQIVFPEVPIHLHHYYTPEEMQWCLQNFELIDKAIKACLRKKDQDVWSFYEEGVVAPDSPSRTQYFWAARVLTQWLAEKLPGKTLKDAVIEAHGWAAVEFDCFA